MSIAPQTRTARCWFYDRRNDPRPSAGSLVCAPCEISARRGLPTQIEREGVAYRAWDAEKSDLVLRMLAEGAVHGFPGWVAVVRVLRAACRRFVDSASENCAAVLDVEIADLFDLRVDVHVTSEPRLAGKPAPHTDLYAASYWVVRGGWRTR